MAESERSPQQNGWHCHDRIKSCPPGPRYGLIGEVDMVDGSDRPGRIEGSLTGPRHS